MRICLISATSIGGDPRAIAQAESLRLAGHEVVGVSPANGDPGWVRTTSPPSPTDRLLRRTQTRLLARTAADTDSDLYLPAHPDALEVALTAAGNRPGSSVLVRPGWPRPTSHDLIRLAPSHPQGALPSSGSQPALHTPGYTPVSVGTQTGHIVVAYRKTERNPGRYLEAALRRAGLDVVRTEIIDWDRIPPSARALVVVESPLPALAVRGTNPGVPVVLWAHHGEHHIDANIRLQRRYRAGLVLLAHSWHLAHRFRGSVDRLPFGVPSELLDPDFSSHGQRRWDVGFVGSESGARYKSRQDLLARLAQRLGSDRVVSLTDIPPEQMANLYRDARVVVDDGAGRHFPITMRVFEATGAGALLVSNSAPGMELLFDPDVDYLPMADDPVEQIARELDEGAEQTAHHGHATAWAHHTYDVRVAELLAATDRARQEGGEPPEHTPVETGLASVVDRFSDAQRILNLGGDLVGRLPGREVWPYHQAEDRAEPGTFHLSVVADGNDSERKRAVAAARLGVVVPTDDAAAVESLVRDTHGEYRRHEMTRGTVFVFGSTGYRLSSDPDPE